MVPQAAGQVRLIAVITMANKEEQYTSTARCQIALRVGFRL